MKSRFPTSAALWPSLASGPLPLTLGETQVFDATNVQITLTNRKLFQTAY